MPNRPGPGRPALVLALAALVLAGSGFTALGIWQLHRLQWKLALIERVQARIHAPPVNPPSRADWPRISSERDEYRHVLLQGHYLDDHATRVKAVTVLGPGYWLLVPLRSTDGSIVLVNRGYVPESWQAPATPENRNAGPEHVTGLLRISEPGGGFLRHNDAAAQRWYSRDVAAIATARGLHDVAPYFVDADAAPGSPGLQVLEDSSFTPTGLDWPRGGLTVVSFRNSHLSYALTWFALALMCAGAGAWLLRDWRRQQSR